MTATTTQGRHPWRATLRTAVAAFIALLSLLPAILAGLHQDATVAGVQILAVAAGITRVLAIPGVEKALHTYAPWLTAQPAPAPLPPAVTSVAPRWPDDSPTQEHPPIR